MSVKLKNAIIISLGLLPLIYWLYLYINVDLYYDEVYSFAHFVLVRFETTLFNYTVPNNHVFFNFVQQILSRLINCRELTQFPENAYFFRLLQGLIALFTGYYSMLIIKRFFNLQNSFLVFVVLFTTIPFMNFSLQLRGYNMCSLFLIMTIYHTLAFIESKHKHNRNFIIIFSALLIYTIPSNIYMLASIITPLAILSIYNIGFQKNRNYVYLISIILICAGITVATILYIPILKPILFNRFVAREPKTIFYSLELIPILLTSFLSKRYLLFGFAIIGFYTFIKKNKKRENLIYALLFFVLIFPFILSFIHHKFPFQRVFIPLSPVFCILISIPLIQLINKIPKPKYVLISSIFLSLYCICIFHYEIKNNNEEMKINLVDKNKLTLSVYQNYYLSDFFNQSNAMNFLKLNSDSKPIFLYEQLDIPSTHLYLAANFLDFTHIKSISEIESVILEEGNGFILTSRKNKTLNELKKIKSVAHSVITDEYVFSNLIAVSRK